MGDKCSCGCQVQSYCGGCGRKLTRVKKVVDERIHGSPDGDSAIVLLEHAGVALRVDRLHELRTRCELSGDETPVVQVSACALRERFES